MGLRPDSLKGGGVCIDVFVCERKNWRMCGCLTVEGCMSSRPCIAGEFGAFGELKRPAVMLSAHQRVSASGCVCVRAGENDLLGQSRSKSYYTHMYTT